MNNEQSSQNHQSSTTTSSDTDIKEEEGENEQSTINSNRPCSSKAVTRTPRESTAAGMMAVHHPTGETHSGGAQHISGSPNTWHLAKNTVSDGRTDHALHPTNDSQRFPAHHHHEHHVSLHIRKSAMTLGTTHSSGRGADQLTASTQLEFNDQDRHFNNHNNMSIGEHSNMSATENVTGSSDSGVMDDHSESSSSVAHHNNHNHSMNINIKAGPSRRKRSYKAKAGSIAGRWTPEEHQAFLEGLKVFGREWKKVAEQIPTRTSAQIRSHAQKYFSKIQREESIILQDQAAAAASASHHQAVSYETAVVEAPHSVQRNVDRILANPSDVQREVEDTLRQLRERYRQLQIRLQETGTTGGGGRGNGLPRARLVEDHTNHYEQQQPPPPRPFDRRKRILEDNSSIGSPYRFNHQDDLSSVSSSVSGFSPTRELASGELIALSVLGASLPRSASNQDLVPPAVAETDAHRQSHSSSPTSTIASNNREPTTALDGSMDDNRSSDSNKKRKITEDNSAASASCQDDNHGDDGDGMLL